MKNLVLFALLMVGASAAEASLNLPTAATYESGRLLCQDKYKDLVSFEKGTYVTVPVDYADLSKGTTDVYAFFSGGYDPKKETILYFTGGPGQTAHWGLFRVSMPYNVLIVEHRGVGCSRPATVQQLLSPSFYSSEFVARDAQKIVKSFGLDKVTAYGISYGTVPATMFGSLFPELTRSVILEGTVYSGSERLWSAPHRRKLMQKMIDGLPTEIKAKMDRISTQYGVPNTWLSRTARGTLMLNDGLRNLRNQLMSLADEKTYQGYIEQLKDMYEPLSYEPHILFTMNEVPYTMISCRELGLANPGTATSDALINGKLYPAPDEDSLNNCKQLNARADQTYFATKYPLKVPVTYFQGSDDSATPSPEGIRHYKEVPQGFKQLLILVRGGHNPNLSNIGNEAPGQKELFAYAVAGKAVPAEFLKKIQKAQELKWVYTSKNAE
ncbi:alpha/beta fold hydrolase [Bdellovibrio sp. NC01]|uniref:alpha/beta fold hydrolase n=1 Tax=Bdellovibrio sp. NC01 TaxID=2220073 RepID=UPI001FEF919D|nr:alpha/beta fold hydrolase [Bdellovibrio sp. NC01]